MRRSVYKPTINYVSSIIGEHTKVGPVSSHTHLLPSSSHTSSIITTHQPKASRKRKAEGAPSVVQQSMPHNEFIHSETKKADEKTPEQKRAEALYHNKKLKTSKKFLEVAMQGGLVNMYDLYPKDKDEFIEQPAQAKILNIKLPFQMVITGKTGSGKTNYVENLEKCLGGFDKIWLVAKDADEFLYKKLIEEIRKEEKATGKQILTVMNSPKMFPNIIGLNEMMRKNKWKGLVIVDDMVNEPLRDMQEILNCWTLGRKGNLSVIYLTQKHYKAPKVIRDNISHLTMGVLSSSNDCARIVKELPQVDMDPKALQKLHQDLIRTENPNHTHNLLTIDMTGKEPGLMYRQNLAPYSIFPKGMSFDQIHKSPASSHEEEKTSHFKS